MSSFLFSVVLVIGLFWGVPFVVSQSFGERSGRRIQTGLFLVLCAVLGAAIYVIYIAEDGAAIVLGVMEVSGFIGGVVKLILAAGMLWCGGYTWREVYRIPGRRGCVAVVAALVLTIFFVPGALLLVIQALTDMFL